MVCFVRVGRGCFFVLFYFILFTLFHGFVVVFVVVVVVVGGVIQVNYDGQTYIWFKNAKA